MIGLNFQDTYIDMTLAAYGTPYSFLIKILSLKKSVSKKIKYFLTKHFLENY